MNTYIVAFTAQSGDPQAAASWKNLSQAIQQHPPWFQLGPATWLVQTNVAVTDVGGFLAKLISPNEIIQVGTVGFEAGPAIPWKTSPPNALESAWNP